MLVEAYNGQTTLQPAIREFQGPHISFLLLSDKLPQLFKLKTTYIYYLRLQWVRKPSTA